MVTADVPVPENNESRTGNCHIPMAVFCFSKIKKILFRIKLYTSEFHLESGILQKSSKPKPDMTLISRVDNQDFSFPVYEKQGISA